MKRATLLTALVSCALLQSAAGADRWTRLSPNDTRTHAKNLANNHLGAIELGRPLADQGFLLKDDPVAPTAVPRGRSERQIQLDDVRAINRVVFFSDGASGKVSVQTALTASEVSSGRWTDVGSAVFEASNYAVEVRFGMIDARYVRLVFDLAVGGTIYEFSIFGRARAGDFMITPSGISGPKSVGLGGVRPPLSPLDFNLARVYAGSHVAYVSSGSGNPTGMIDADSTTDYRFAAADAAPTVIVALPHDLAVDRVSALFSSPVPGTMEVYVLNSLPEERNWAGRATVPSHFLRDVQATHVTRNVAGAGTFDARFPPVAGRYVAVRFIPVNSPLHGAAAFDALDSQAAVDSASPKFIALGVFSGNVGSGYHVVPAAPDEFDFEGPLADFSSNLFPGRGIAGQPGRSGSLPEIEIVSP